MAGSTLQALTESAQKNQPALKKRTNKPHPTRPRYRVEKKQKLAFDENARREFLTGFSKRKQQRKQRAHDKLQARIRDEIRTSRRDAAQARKEQAAENVRAERQALGLLSDDDKDQEEAPMHTEHDFENEERRAHVTVQEFDMDTDWSAPTPNKIEELPPSSHRATKKEAAPEPPAGISKKKSKPLASRPSGTLTSILEPDVADPNRYLPMEEEPRPAPTKRAPTYTSAAERAQERKHQRERNHKLAELRREENRTRAKSGTGARKKVSTTGKRRS